MRTDETRSACCITLCRLHSLAHPVQFVFDDIDEGFVVDIEVGDFDGFVVGTRFHFQSTLQKFVVFQYRKARSQLLLFEF